MSKHALVIGVQHPAMPTLARLITPATCLQQLAETLRDPGVGTFDEVRLLLDPDGATLKQAVEGLFVGSHATDELLLYLATLGWQDVSGELWWLAADTALPPVPSGALSSRALMDLLALSDCRRQFLVFDCALIGTGAEDRPKQPLFSAAGWATEQRAVLAAGVDARVQWTPAVVRWVPNRESLCPALSALLRDGDRGDLGPAVTLGRLYQRLLRRDGGVPPVDALDLSAGCPLLLDVPLARNAAVPVEQAPDAEASKGGARRSRRKTARRKAASARGHGVYPFARRKRPLDRLLPVLAGMLALLVLSGMVSASVRDWATSAARVSVINRLNSWSPGIRSVLWPDAGPLRFRDVLLDGRRGPEMLALRGGYFVMGSPPTEAERFPAEGPQRLVRVDAFAIGIAEVSFAEYGRFAAATGRRLPEDADWGRGARPVINVGWADAVAYADWLSAQSGQHYRLPSEAEWEFAARAGSNGPFSTGICIDTDQANYNGTYDYNRCGARTTVNRGQTLAVRSLKPNAWGLHDMHGNVWEWTQDCWHASYRGAPPDALAWLGELGGQCERRVIRGGGWRFEPGFLRSAARLWETMTDASRDVGFRVARDL